MIAARVMPPKGYEREDLVAAVDDGCHMPRRRRLSPQCTDTSLWLHRHCFVSKEHEQFNDEIDLLFVSWGKISEQIESRIRTICQFEKRLVDDEASPVCRGRLRV